MATEEWIQESLARLESLEEERKKHEDALETTSDPAELQQHNQAIERLEVKIRALYAELEAVAAEAGDGSDGSDDGGDDSDDLADAGDSDDVGDDEQTVVAAPSRPAPAPVAAAPVAAPFASAPAAPFASAPAAPFASAPAAPVSPFGEVPPASPFGSPPAASPFGSPPAEAGTSFPSSTASFDSDSDGDSGGSGSKVGVIIGLVVVLAGAGAYFVLGRKPPEEPKPAAPVEVKVIKSGDVPPDTQGPRTAKGGDIDATKGAVIKESERRGGGGGGGGGGHSAPSPDPGKKKVDNKATKIENTDDPLAGIK